MKRGRLRKVGKSKESTLRRTLDTIYSVYVRRVASDDRGYINCYCGAKVKWQESDNSHYIPRGCLALRYDPRNTHPSCRRCNRFMGGNLQAYSLYLEQKYGAGILQELNQEKHKIVKLSTEWYEEKIRKYATLLSEL